MLVCGVDSSTQSTKVELRDLDSGQVVGVARAPHRATSPPRSEQDPSDWWDALVKSLAQLGPALGDVGAISIAAQQHGLVVLGEDGTVLRKAKLWNDTESATNAEALVDMLGPQEWARRCGSVPVAAFTITKLAWLAEHEPDLFRAVDKVMLPHDWLTYRLSGRHVTDRGDASGSGWWSPLTADVDYGLLKLVDGQRDWSTALPRVLAPFEVAGSIMHEAAAATGLPAGCLVAAGSGDNMAAALGLGLGTGDVVMSLGTSGTVYAVSAHATSDPRGFVAGFADGAGAFLPLVCTLNATKVTDVLGALLGLDRDEFAGLALSAAAGGSGLTLLPYLDGERTPNLPGARGSLLGLSAETSRADVARAAHEGVVCGLLGGMDALTDVDVQIGGRFFLVGGGSRSGAYQRVVADLSQRQVRVPDEDEVVATGACVQAAAMHSGEDVHTIAQRWGLGRGNDIDPDGSVDATGIRDRYDSLIPR